LTDLKQGELASLFGLRQLVEQVRGTLHHKKLRRSTAPNDLSALPVSRQADLILAEATAALKLCQVDFFFFFFFPPLQPRHFPKRVLL